MSTIFRIMPNSFLYFSKTLFHFFYGLFYIFNAFTVSFSLLF